MHVSAPMENCIPVSIILGMDDMYVEAFSAVRMTQKFLKSFVR